MTNQVCSEPKCVGLATTRGLCPPHAAGYKKYSSIAELRCAHCRGLILKDSWYQLRDGATFHVKACKEHADVKKEREARETQPASVTV